MSLLNVWSEPDRVVIAVDTEAAIVDGSFGAMSKILHISHANVVIAARGDRRMLFDLFQPFFLAAVDIDFDRIVADIPQALAHAVERVRRANVGAVDYEVAIAGYSVAKNRMVCVWLTGCTTDTDFDIDLIDSKYSPWDEASMGPAPEPKSLGEVKEMAMTQARYLKSRGAAGGGHLLLAEMNKNAYKVTDVGKLQ